MQKLRNYLAMTVVFAVCLLLWCVLAPVDHVIHVTKKYRRKAALRTAKHRGCNCIYDAPRQLAAKGEAL